MSNEVYGYIESSEAIDWNRFFLNIQSKMGIGIQQMPKSELYNFPEDMLPSKDSFFLPFIMGDKPGKKNTTYLTDVQDYSSKAFIGLPNAGKDRLNILIDVFLLMSEERSVERLVVAITDSSQIEEVKKLNIKSLPNQIYEDFEMQLTPDCIYDVIVS